MKIFETANIGSLQVKNRIIRSATFEGMCDENGFPTEQYKEHYSQLAQNDVATIITGFSYTSKEGSALQPGQAAIDSDDKIDAFCKITEAVHHYDCKIVMQIAHTGRQTRSSATGFPVVGVSPQASPYFREKPRELTTDEVYERVQQFVDAAYRAKKAGFDGIQLHAAHGYLIHQFLHPYINKRKDIFGIDKQSGIGVHFIECIIKGIQVKCGCQFPILVKVSASDDTPKPFTEAQFIHLVKALGKLGCTAIEVSYGTMADSFNIFRASSIPTKTILNDDPVYHLKNPLLRKLWILCAVPILSHKLKPFSPTYNLTYAKLAKKHCSIPIITVGGFRTQREISNVLKNNEVDFVALCRPFLCDNKLILKLKENQDYTSPCSNCNICAVKTGTNEATQCVLTTSSKNK